MAELCLCFSFCIQLKARLQALDAENTKLRQDSMAANEEIFGLRASIAVADAEAKYYVEVETKKMQSELNFKVSIFFPNTSTPPHPVLLYFLPTAKFS